MRFKYATYGAANTPAMDMTPMIDIIFNLLLFFILSTSYIQHSAMEVSLPQATTATVLENQVVVVDLTRDDRIYLQGEEMTLDHLKTELEKIYSADISRPLLVRADQDAIHGHVVAILDLSRKIGIKTLNIATLPTMPE